MNKIYFALFISIFSLIYFGIHYYTYNRIIYGLMVSGPVKNYIKIFFLISALSFVIIEFISRKVVISPWIKIAAQYSSVWIGAISIAVTVFLVADILRIFFHSQPFRYYSVIFSLIVIAVISLYSIYNVAREPFLKEIKIKTGKLPSNLPKFSIIQLSDVHLNFLKSEEWLNKIVDKTNSQNPDLIVITGDLIDADVEGLKNFYEILKRLKSKYGVFAVTGNHEFYAGIDKFLEIAKNSNIAVLRNEKRTIANYVELIGIDDNTGKRFSETGSDLKGALKNCDFKKLVVLLSHQPDVFDEAVKSGVDLQLSGHTHAGQIPPMDLIVEFYFKYPYGLYQKNTSYLYTTSGTGIWGPPMRLFSRSEIIKIVLEK
ncbi:MAG: metallophosphoesterase [Elusimicrobia bacterium]|nr:metallophosphoesterase [Elusimicrobiota bacterium]